MDLLGIKVFKQRGEQVPRPWGRCELRCAWRGGKWGERWEKRSERQQRAFWARVRTLTLALSETEPGADAD